MTGELFRGFRCPRKSCQGNLEGRCQILIARCEDKYGNCKFWKEKDNGDKGTGKKA